jgi:hypothetical protein
VAYDTKDFVAAARELNVTPHVTRNDKGWRSNLDRRTTRQPGYAISLSRRWLAEKSFGWLKQTGPLHQVKLRGLENVDWLFVLSCAAHNALARSFTESWGGVVLCISRRDGRLPGGSLLSGGRSKSATPERTALTCLLISWSMSHGVEKFQSLSVISA